MAMSSHPYATYQNGNGNPAFWQAVDHPLRGRLDSAASYTLPAYHSGTCANKADKYWEVNFFVVDGTGALHSANGGIVDELGCNPQMTTTASDGSGYTLILSSAIPMPEQATIYDRHGNKIIAKGPFGLDPGWGPSSSSITDSDGNLITAVNGTYTDSFGVNALTVSNVLNYSAGNDSYSYPGFTPGSTQQYQVLQKSYTEGTAFGCTAVHGHQISDWIETTGPTYYLPYQINLPDGSSYQIQYEQIPGYSGNGPFGPYTTGRVSKIIYSGGGSITYSYGGSNNGIYCDTLVVPTLTVTVSDNNGNAGTWTYVNSHTGLSSPNFTVTETTPTGDTITHYFDGEYETERLVKDVNLGVLSTTVTCYNKNYSSQSSCVSPAWYNPTQITQTDVYTSFGTSAPSLVETQFDSYGNTTAVKKFSFGATYPPSGTPASETDTTYAGVSGITC